MFMPEMKMSTVYKHIKAIHRDKIFLKEKKLHKLFVVTKNVCKRGFEELHVQGAYTVIGYNEFIASKDLFQ